MTTISTWMTSIRWYGISPGLSYGFVQRRLHVHISPRIHSYPYREACVPLSEPQPCASAKQIVDPTLDLFQADGLGIFLLTWPLETCSQ